MLVLGIETSCDETAAAVVKEGKEILSNCVTLQTDLHQTFGGVVPELACRRHVDVIVPVIERALAEATIPATAIDLIAVTCTPGLVGALLIGLNAAKAMALALERPLIGVNHVEAHLYAAIMSYGDDVTFPALGAVFSGGHTALLLINGYGQYQLISSTVDDAIGEAFDKVAKIMGLPYPGGPEIEALAKRGNPYTYPLKGGTVKGRPLHFSFSGLKTAVLYSLKGQNSVTQRPLPLTESEQCNMAASFQHAAFNDVIGKTLQAAHHYGCQTVVFGGGVTNSQTLRRSFAEKAPDNLRLLWPAEGLALDNAAMIAGLGYHQYHLRGGDSLTLEASPTTCFHNPSTTSVRHI